MSGTRKAPPISTSSPRDDRFLALDQRVEHKQHGGGVVVDDGGGEVPGLLTHRGGQDFGEQWLDQRIAVAAAAVGDVVFERAGRGGGNGHCFDRFRCEQRATEVGMQHGAGQIEDRAQVRLREFSTRATMHVASASASGGRARSGSVRVPPQVQRRRNR